MTDLDEKLKTLYGHWVIADTIKYFVRVPLKGLPEELNIVGQHSQFLRLQVWYALLYVVVEGYRAVGRSDPAIDALLAQTDMTEGLRRLRNAIFHPQENPLSEKLWGFLMLPDSEIWIRKLHSAMEAFFEANPPVKDYVERAKAALKIAPS
jgi:hypothetical protein